jgi:hypothetical protein
MPVDIHKGQHQLFEYIESFYSRHRLHSTLGYVTPDERLRLLAAAQASITNLSVKSEEAHQRGVFA